MKKTYFNLPESRQEEIGKICMEEFITFGYDQASINRMIGKLKIAKGSFYNYTESKEDLYLFFLQEIYHKTEKILMLPESYKTRDIFDRSEELINQSMELYRRYPFHYQLILQAELDTRASIYPKAAALRKKLSPQNAGALFENVDWEQYRFPKEEVIILFLWLTGGIREDIRARMNGGMGFDELAAISQQRIKLYKESLTHGIYKR